MTVKIAKHIKDDFPWFKHNPRWTYLDSSATSLKPKYVIDSIVNFYEKWSSNPHNSDSSLTYHVSEMVDEVRGKLAKLINANKPEVIFTSGATESLTLVAHGLQPYINKGDEIIVTFGEHTSNLLPWMELNKNKGSKLVVVGNENQVPTEKDIIKAINRKTKIVSFANISNLIGYELDMKKITDAVRKINKDVYVVCDATQAIPHKRFDVKKADIDFLVCSAHKMCAGTGIGMVYMKSKYLDKIDPLRLGGGMNNNVSCQGYTFASGPDKFEGGSPHTAGIMSWGAAIDYLNAYGWNKIAQHEVMLKKYINQEFAKIKNLEYVNPEGKYPIVAFNMKVIHAQDLANYLGYKKIIVRGGLSCAKLAHHIVRKQSVVRASFYFYNDKHDVDVLVQALKAFKKGDIVNHVI